MRGPRTLRNRLALVAVLTTAAWVLGLTTVFNLLLVAQLRHQADDLLRTRAAAALSTVQVGPAGRLTVREPPNDAALDLGVWIYQGGRVVAGPAARPAVQAAADAMAGGGPRFADVPGSAVRLHAVPVQHNGSRVGTVVTATSLEPYRRTSRTALIGSGTVAFLLIAGAYLVTRRVVADALTPVTEMADQAAQWSAHDVEQRFGDAPRPTELRDLAASLDAVLDRVGAVLRHEQQLAAELSHELRTPLAVVAAETELLQDGARTEQERTKAYAVIAETTDRMTRLLDTLLAHAAQTVTDSPGSCSVAGVVTEALLPARENGLQTWVSGPPGLDVGASAEVLSRILSPIVGNATRYARTSVTVTAERAAGTVRLLVADDGPGVPADFGERVFEPGQRSDPDDGHAGAGLGLALARRLARASGGDISLLPRDGRDEGAVFLVTLPAA